MSYAKNEIDTDTYKLYAKLVKTDPKKNIWPSGSYLINNKIIETTFDVVATTGKNNLNKKAYYLVNKKEMLGKGNAGSVYPVVGKFYNDPELFFKKNYDNKKIVKIVEFTEGDQIQAYADDKNEQKIAEKIGHLGVRNSVIDITANKKHVSYRVTNKMPGVTLDEIINNQLLSNEQIGNIILGLLDWLVLFEEKKIIHRDIKPENIMVSLKQPRTIIKNNQTNKLSKCKQPLKNENIIDFGLSILGDDCYRKSFAAGTVEYMPPEILNHPSEISIKADVFAAGIVFGQLCGGRQRNNFPELLNQLKSKLNCSSDKDKASIQNKIDALIIKTISMPKKFNHLGKNLTLMSDKSKELIDTFIGDCLAYDVNKRFSPKQAHAAFLKIKSIVFVDNKLSSGCKINTELNKSIKNVSSVSSRFFLNPKINESKSENNLFSSILLFLKNILPFYNTNSQKEKSTFQHSDVWSCIYVPKIIALIVKLNTEINNHFLPLRAIETIENNKQKIKTLKQIKVDGLNYILDQCHNYPINDNYENYRYIKQVVVEAKEKFPHLCDGIFSSRTDKLLTEIIKKADEYANNFNMKNLN